MEQPTTEEKARYFSNHKGADLVVINSPKEHWYPFDTNEGGLRLAGVLNQRVIVNRIAEEVHDKFNQCALSLFDLSDISDEDAIKAFGGLDEWEFYERSVTPLYFKLRKKYDKDELDFNEDGFKYRTVSVNINYVRAYQFLQSKSYALPWNGYSVEQLISFGWLKIKEKA